MQAISLTNIFQASAPEAERIAEHQKILKRLETEARALRRSVSLLPTLKEKIQAKAALKAKEEVIWKHKLNYFDFISQAK
jgi:hypothetical protein